MKRHALFAGVNNYNDKSIRPLRYSVPDASVLADRLKGLGYKARLLADPTGAELKAAVMEPVEGLGRGDVFLFFFAGHGFTAQDGAHLLFCRDDIQRLLRVNAAGVRVDALEALTGGVGFHRAFLLDSCRTDCFAGMENPVAQNNLGEMYADGRGVPQDDAEAAKWYRRAEKGFRKAAERGDMYAQCRLGNLYTVGRGVPQDDAEAAKWYRKAAEQGMDVAQFILGEMYTGGCGVPHDDAEALKWYRKAAEQGLEEAKEALERLAR